MKHYAMKFTAILLLASALQACGNTTVKAVDNYCFFTKPIHGGEGVPVEVQAEIDAHNAVYDEQCAEDDGLIEEMEDDAFSDAVSF